MSSGAGNHVGSGGLIEFELAIQVGRFDGRGSGWQADGREEGLNGFGLDQGSNDLHVPRAAGAHTHIVLKNTSQELGPRNAMGAAATSGVYLGEVAAPAGLTGEVRPLQQVEHDAIVAALQASRGKVSGPGGAAQLLGLKPSTLESRMKKLGIERLRASI